MPSAPDEDDDAVESDAHREWQGTTLGHVAEGFGLILLVTVLALIVNAATQDRTGSRVSSRTSAPSHVPPSGEDRACSTFELRAAGASAMTQAALDTWAKTIKADADEGVYHPLQLAADQLYVHTRPASIPATDHQLEADLHALFHACRLLRAYEGQ
jgi:hypothetical protein